MIVSYYTRSKLNNYDKLKDIIYSNGDYPLPLTTYILDHIIPWVLTQDDNLSNLRLLTPAENKIKTRMDWTILIQLRKEGYTEKITNYSIELLSTKEEVRERYLELWYQLTQGNPRFDFINKTKKRPQ